MAKDKTKCKTKTRRARVGDDGKHCHTALENSVVHCSVDARTPTQGQEKHVSMKAAHHGSEGLSSESSDTGDSPVVLPQVKSERTVRPHCGRVAAAGVNLALFTQRELTASWPTVRFHSGDVTFRKV